MVCTLTSAYSNIGGKLHTTPPTIALVLIPPRRKGISRAIELVALFYSQISVISTLNSTKIQRTEITDNVK